MMRKPLTPILSPGSAPETMLPPDNDREGLQPYAKELEDYKHGAVRAARRAGRAGANPKPDKGAEREVMWACFYVRIPASVRGE